MMECGFEGVKGLGPKRKQALKDAGLDTPEKLLMYFPTRYLDFTRTKPIADCIPGDEAVLDVRLAGLPSQVRVNGKTITRAVLMDESGSLPAAWFNQPWMFKTLSESESFTVYGTVQSKNGKRSLQGPRLVTEKKLTPVYKPVEGITNAFLKQLIEFAFENTDITRETLPQSIMDKYGLICREEALKQIHFPTDLSSLQNALRRNGFENLLYFMLSAFKLNSKTKDGACIPWNKDELNEYISSLPFPLTNAQKSVLDEIGNDLQAPTAMARLVQGDVGCGKTAVAFASIFMAARAGYQCAMMAPTEILACQHYESALKSLAQKGIACGLLTGSMSAKQRKDALNHIKSGEWQAIFGTHALISEDVEYKRLGLAITDEQHRFGVRQRTRLGEKGDNPNVLVMSATPIPRTLALILYGDLDISIIDELPPGRQPVKTRIVPGEKRNAMYGFILDEIKKGRQAYFVCPLVEESEAVEAESAESLFDSLINSPLGKARAALVHGKMKQEAKDAALESFRKGETDILVSTTVIEVGINVPNATVMVVENAERFGLAQLHQLRGRVGRGKDEAWCFLMSKNTQKLKVLTQSNDGFFIAEKDMELRGPGDMFGTRQSGAVSGLDPVAASDGAMLKDTHDLAKEIAQSDAPEAEQIKANADIWFKTQTGAVFAAN